MGKAMSVLSRQANRFNVENRAHKLISQDKPKAAPKFSSNLKDLERVLKDHPEIVEEQSRKNLMLDSNLKNVYVTSTDPIITVSPTPDPTKPLPLNKKPVEDFELGFKEPQTVSRGRISFRNALKMIADHQTDPKEWPATKLANTYALKEETVKDILDHFQTFQIYIPDQSKRRENLLIQSKRKLLDDKSNMSDEEPKK